MIAIERQMAQTAIKKQQLVPGMDREKVDRDREKVCPEVNKTNK